MRSSRSKRRVVLCVVLLLAAHTVGAQEPAWRLSQAEAAVPATDVRETRWQMDRLPAGPADRIQLHRYRGTSAPRAALLFLPGTNMNGEIAVTDGAEPTSVAGLLAFDGAFKNHVAKARSDRATEMAKLEAANGWASDVSGRMGWAARQQLMQAALAEPPAPAPDPKYPTARAQVAQTLHSAWGPGALANPVDGLSRSTSARRGWAPTGSSPESTPPATADPRTSR